MAAILVSMSGVAPVALTGALAVQIRDDLGLSAAALGAALAVLFTLSGVVARPAGELVGRVGWRAGALMTSTVAASALLSVAVFAHDTTVFVGVLAVGGLSLALSVPTGAVILAAYTPRNRQGRMFAVKQTAVPLASMLAGLSVPAIAVSIGWRWAFGLGASVAIATAVAALTTPDPVPAAGSDVSPGASTVPPLRRLPAGFGLMGFAGGLAATAAGGLSTFLVVTAVEAGVAEGTAGLLAAGASLSSLLVRLVVGAHSDRRPGRALCTIAWMLAGGSIGFALLALGSPAATVAGALAAKAVGWGWPGLYYFSAVQLASHMPAGASGVLQRGMSYGSAAGPLAFGVIADTLGFPWAWTAGGACLLAAAALMRAAERRYAAGREAEYVCAEIRPARRDVGAGG